MNRSRPAGSAQGDENLCARAVQSAQLRQIEGDVLESLEDRFDSAVGGVERRGESLHSHSEICGHPHRLSPEQEAMRPQLG